MRRSGWGKEKPWVRIVVPPAASSSSSSSSSSTSIGSMTSFMRMLPSACVKPRPILAMAVQGIPTGTQKVKLPPSGDKSAVLQKKNNVEGSSIKLLSRVEQLKLLSKAEKAGLLSAAENFGLSLSTIEKLGLLSKAEELGILSAATDPNTPGTLLNLAIVLLFAGPLCVYFVPEDSVWQIGLQVMVALLSVVGGPAAFAGSNFVSMLQKAN